MLGFLAVTGVAALAAGRAAEQTRRPGLLKAVGATPGLIAAVLLTEFLALALVAQILGLVVARLVEPAIANPTASRVGGIAGPDATTLVASTILVLAVAVLTTLPVTGITGLLIGASQPVKPYGFGAAALPNIRDEQNYRLMLTVTVMLVALAIVNTIAITWMTAMESRVSMAVTRALGATPGQVSAGLSFAQLLPAVPGAVVGVYLGIFLFGIFSAGDITIPPSSWFVGSVLITLVATAALTALPARVAARHPVGRTLSAETT